MVGRSRCRLINGMRSGGCGVVVVSRRRVRSSWCMFKLLLFCCCGMVWYWCWIIRFGGWMSLEGRTGGVGRLMMVRKGLRSGSGS